jgi:hypothetical protein
MMEEMSGSQPTDYEEFVNALEVIAEVSESVVHELGQQTITAAERATFKEVAPIAWEESTRRFNRGMGKMVGGVALDTVGLALEAVAQTTPADHKSLIAGGVIIMGLGASAVFCGAKQIVKEISWAIVKTEDEKELIEIF